MKSILERIPLLSYNFLMPEKIELKRIPPLSTTVLKILELEKKPAPEVIKELPKIIEKDPGISSEILKIANSPYYGFISEITSIPHAINLLGTESVKNIALRISITNMMDTLRRETKAKDKYNYFIKRSLVAALFSKTFSKVNGIGSPDVFLTIGLLLKIGELLLILNFEDKYNINLENNEDEILKEERERFGIDSVEAGKWIVSEWNLPLKFYEAINNQTELKQQTETAKIAYVANYFSKALLRKEKIGEEFKRIREEIENFFNLDVIEIGLFKEEFIEELEIFKSEAPLLKEEFLEISSRIKQIEYLIFGDEEKTEIEKEEIKLIKERLFNERKKLTANIRLASSLNWVSEPSFIINKLLLHLKTSLSGDCEEFKFIYWDNRISKFVAYKLDGVKNLTHEYDIKKAPLYERAFTLRELQIKSLEDRIIVAIPVFFGTQSYGIISIIFPKERFNYELLKNLSLSASFTAQAMHSYNTEKQLKKEIEKRLMLLSELKEFSREKEKIKQILKEVEESHLHKYILKSIIHKINNKMTPILGYSDMLMTSLTGKDLEKIEKINNNSIEAINLLNSILEYFSKVEEEKTVLDINETIKETLNLIEYRIKGFGINVSLNLKENLPKIYFNKLHLRDAISNLIANAIEALKESNKEEKKIKISTDYDNYLFYITIHDNGIGIEKEKIDSIMEPFFTTKKDSSGLGLNFVHGFAHTNGGKVEIQSTPGEGTTVTLTFSAKLVKEEIPQKEMEPKDAKILIVDNEESLVELMDDILSLEGFSNLKNAYSGEEALNLIDKENFDLIVSDVSMPKFSGIDIFKKLKDKKREKNLIFVTADPTDLRLKEITETHKIPILKKPFSLSDFINVVKSRIKNTYSEV